MSKSTDSATVSAPETPTAGKGQSEGSAASKSERDDQPDQAAIWPRDMNAATTADPIWGRDPEGLVDA